MAAEKFQIYSVKIIANTFVSQKVLLMPPSKTPRPAPYPPPSPGFYRYLPGRQELPIPPEQHFQKIFFPEQKEGGEEYGVEKITKISNVIGHRF